MECCRRRDGQRALRDRRLRSALCAELWGGAPREPCAALREPRASPARALREHCARRASLAERRASAAFLVMDSRLKPEPSGGRP